MISSIPKWIGDLLESATGPRLTVLETTYITPAIKKICFHGNISKMHFLIGGASVIRVSDTDYRNYTVAHCDHEKGILDILFHIHGNGVGSKYIDGLKPGDELHISIPRGHAVYDKKAKKHFIFGDETALGLACSLLPVLQQNGHLFQCNFELEEVNKEAPKIVGLENCTVFLKEGSFRDEKWIAQLPVLQTNDWAEANFVLAGNVKSVQAFRKVLKKYATGKIYAQGYWLEGKKGL